MGLSPSLDMPVEENRTGKRNGKKPQLRLLFHDANNAKSARMPRSTRIRVDGIFWPFVPGSEGLRHLFFCSSSLTC